MSTDKKPEDQITEATAVELDESQLDNASGGDGILDVRHSLALGKQQIEAGPYAFAVDTKAGGI